MVSCKIFAFIRRPLISGELPKGTLITPATWIRNFVHSHPAYKFDSVVNQEINYDLFVAIDEM